MNVQAKLVGVKDYTIAKKDMLGPAEVNMTVHIKTGEKLTPTQEFDVIHQVLVQLHGMDFDVTLNRE